MGLKEEICSGELRLDACDPVRFSFKLKHAGNNYCVSRIVSLSADALVVEGPLPEVSKTADLLNLKGPVEIEIAEYILLKDGPTIANRALVRGHGSHLFDRKKSEADIMLRYMDIKVNEVIELGLEQVAS